MRPWFSGRTTGCQSVGGSSILPGRTKRFHVKHKNDVICETIINLKF